MHLQMKHLRSRRRAAFKTDPYKKGVDYSAVMETTSQNARLDREEGWRLVKDAAHAMQISGERWQSPRQNREYAVERAEDNKITISRLSGGNTEVLTLSTRTTDRSRRPYLGIVRMIFR
jgi:hypothetical protein